MFTLVRLSRCSILSRLKYPLKLREVVEYLRDAF